MTAEYLRADLNIVPTSAARLNLEGLRNLLPLLLMDMKGDVKAVPLGEEVQADAYALIQA